MLTSRVIASDSRTAFSVSSRSKVLPLVFAGLMSRKSRSDTSEMARPPPHSGFVVLRFHCTLGSDSFSSVPPRPK